MLSYFQGPNTKRSSLTMLRGSLGKLLLQKDDIDEPSCSSTMDDLTNFSLDDYIELGVDYTIIKSPQPLNANSSSTPVVEKHKKTVRFGDNTTYEIKDLQSSSNKNNKRTMKKNTKNNKQLWYTKAELDLISKDNTNLIHKATLIGINAGYVDSSSSRLRTIRGLEHLLPDDIMAKKRQYFKHQSRIAVLNEQHRQIMKQQQQLQQDGLGLGNGDIISFSQQLDPNLIKAAYESGHANKCQKVAIEHALHDEQVARELIRQEQQQQEKKHKRLSSKISQNRLWFHRDKHHQREN